MLAGMGKDLLKPTLPATLLNDCGHNRNVGGCTLLNTLFLLFWCVRERSLLIDIIWLPQF